MTQSYNYLNVRKQFFDIILDIVSEILIMKPLKILYKLYNIMFPI